MIKLEHYYLALLHLTSFLLNSKSENHTLERGGAGSRERKWKNCAFWLKVCEFGSYTQDLTTFVRIGASR